METQRVTAETRDFLETERASRPTEPDDGGLTEAGWPRERRDGWPIPWISPRRELGMTDEARFQACSTGAICAVCGLGYQADELALAICRPPDDVGTLVPGDVVVARDPDEGILPIDNGILHSRCTRLALAYCPKLNELMEDDELVILEVVAHTAVPRLQLTGPPGKQKELLVATFDEGTVVELPL